MKEEMRTIGYLCPACHKSVIQSRSAFALAASGAVVQCECGKSSLTVDAATGGTVLNVAYAETGTLNLENVGKDALITVPGSLQGLSLAGWTVNLPQGMRNRTVEMKNGQIQIRKNGLAIIVR